MILVTPRIKEEYEDYRERMMNYGKYFDQILYCRYNLKPFMLWTIITFENFLIDFADGNLGFYPTVHLHIIWMF